MDLSAKLWYQSPEMRVKENMKKKLKFSKATVHKSCKTVAEKFVRISLLLINSTKMSIIHHTFNTLKFIVP
jgi:histidinol phosphatase-like PHP family hydrolase